MLFLHPLEPVRPCPASLAWHPPVAPPRLARPMQVRALPAGFRAEHSARGLEARIERRQAARSAGHLRVVREAEAVVVAVCLAGEGRRELLVAVGVREPPGPVWRDVDAGIARGDPS